MSPEQFSQFLESNEKATATAIQKFVNGKIDNLTKKVEDQHEFMVNHAKEDKEFQEKMSPYLEGAAGLKTVREFAVWIAGALIAYNVIKDFIK